MSKTIAIIATCDTKGEEAAYIRQRIESYGVGTLVIDAGVLGEPLFVTPDISHHDVAAVSDMTIDEVKALGSRGAAVEVMCKGVNTLVGRLSERGEIDGLIAMGGAEGSLLSRAAMDALPLGVPKITVSSIASGEHKFKDVIGYNDAVVMHSVIDILGINSISRQIFNTAVGGIVGMVNAPKPEEIATAKRVGITMLGTTTKPILEVIKPNLEREGYEVFTFHANGVGGACMEDLAKEGYFSGILDFSTNEIVANCFGGLHVARPERMQVLMDLGIPVIAAPGALSLIVLSTEDALNPKYDGRQKYYHNERITLVRTGREEMAILGRKIAEILNTSKGNVRFAYPQRGFASQDKEGMALYDPTGNEMFYRELKEHLRSDIELISVDAHINDVEFAQVCFDQLMDVISIAQS